MKNETSKTEKRDRMDCLERIKEMLAERNWSMYTLSQKSGIPQSTLSNLFLRCNSPSIPTLEKICDAFQVSLAYFFGGTESNLTEDENRLLREWKRLPAETQQALLVFLSHIK